MKTIKQSSSPLRNTNGGKIYEIKNILLKMLSEGTVRNYDIAKRFSIDISTVRAMDCVYIYAIQELISQGRMEEVLIDGEYNYRSPAPKLF